MNFETYADIFEKRGEDYHRAMSLAPDARANEFRAVLDHVTLRDGDVVCDIPSGGGYLFRYFPGHPDLRLVTIDPTAVFARKWHDPRIEGHLASMHDLPFRDADIDVMISIAGLHHVDNRLAVFAEMRRVVRQGGQLCILEVAVGSIADRFLNSFVDAHSSMGHRGSFIDDGFRNELRHAGWAIELDVPCRYTWDFPDEHTLIQFLILIFGMDQADHNSVLNGVDEILGRCHQENGVKVNWELRLLLAR